MCGNCNWKPKHPAQHGSANRPESAHGSCDVTLNLQTSNARKAPLETAACSSTSEHPKLGSRNRKALLATFPPIEGTPPLRRLKTVLPPQSHRHSQPLTLSRSSAAHPPALRSSPGRSCHAHAAAHASPPLDAHAVKGGASSPRLRKPRARRLPPIGKQSGACLAPHVRVQPRRLCPRGLWLR